MTTVTIEEQLDVLTTLLRMFLIESKLGKVATNECEHSHFRVVVNASARFEVVRYDHSDCGYILPFGGRDYTINELTSSLTFARETHKARNEADQ